MKLLDRFFPRRLAAMSPAAVTKAPNFLGLEAEGYRNGRPDTIRIGDYGTFINAYANLPWLYAGVTALAIAAAKPPLLVKREVKQADGTVKQEKVEGQEINRLLEAPNKGLTMRELRQVTAINMALTGNAYWNLVGTSAVKPVIISKKNKPVEIWWLKPEQVTPELDVTGAIGKYIFTSVAGKEEPLTLSEIVHFRQANPRSYHVGMGILEPLINTATLEFNATTFQKKYLENDGTPPFIFEHPGSPTDDEMDRFKRRWDAAHKGPNKAGRFGIAFGGMKVSKLGDGMKDAQYVELRKLNREEMLAAAGVPPSVVGLLEYANYSNMEVQQRKFWEDAVIPMLDLIAETLTLRLATYFDERVWVEFDYSGIRCLQEDDLRRAQVAEIWLRTGVKSPNDIRAEMNLEPYTGGNVYYIPLGLVPTGGKDYVEPAPPSAPAPPPQDPKPADGDDDPDEDEDSQKDSDPAGQDPDAGGDDDPKDKAAPCACCAHKDGDEPAPKPSYWRDPERAKSLWQAFEKRVTSKERGMVTPVEKYLRQQAVHIKRRLAKYDSLAGVRPAELFDAEAEAKLYLEKFDGRYRAAFEDAAEAGLKATKGHVYVGVEGKADLEFKPTPEQLATLKKQILEAAQFFNATTWETIQHDLELAKLDSDTVEEFAQDLWKHLDDLSVSRARLISRTEMARVENWGGLEGFKQNEHVNRKGWLCSKVPDSREAHILADGQEVGINEPFNVGGEPMQYPGAPGAKAWNVCNCLCTEYPVIEEA